MASSPTRLWQITIRYVKPNNNITFLQDWQAFGEMRCITIDINAVAVGERRPEDEHHPNGQPILETGECWCYVL